MVYFALVKRRWKIKKFITGKSGLELKLEESNMKFEVKRLKSLIAILLAMVLLLM